MGIILKIFIVILGFTLVLLHLPAGCEIISRSSTSYMTPKIEFLTLGEIISKKNRKRHAEKEYKRLSQNMMPKLNEYFQKKYGEDVMSYKIIDKYYEIPYFINLSVQLKKYPNVSIYVYCDTCEKQEVIEPGFEIKNYKLKIKVENEIKNTKIVKYNHFINASFYGENDTNLDCDLYFLDDKIIENPNDLTEICQDLIKKLQNLNNNKSSVSLNIKIFDEMAKKDFPNYNENLKKEYFVFLSSKLDFNFYDINEETTNNINTQIKKEFAKFKVYKIEEARIEKLINKHNINTNHDFKITYQKIPNRLNNLNTEKNLYGIYMILKKQDLETKNKRKNIEEELMEIIKAAEKENISIERINIDEIYVDNLFTYFDDNEEISKKRYKIEEELNHNYPYDN